MPELSPKNWKPKTLVTGANGFVGRRICKALLSAGLDVVAGVRRGADVSGLDGMNVEFRYGDLTDSASLNGLVEGTDAVIHNAGVVKARRQSMFKKVNAVGSESLIQAALNSNTVKRFIFVSSQAAAGPSFGEPRLESDSPAPVSEYGRSKLQGERALAKYQDKIELQIVRPVSVYGPGDREMFSFFEIVSKGIRPKVGDISRRIQLIHVDDLSQAILALLLSEARSGECYFIAEKTSYSFKELIDHIGSAVGRKGVALPVPGWLLRVIGALVEVSFSLIGKTPMLTRDKAHEILQSWEVSIEKAMSHFGFSPQNKFPTGALETVAWYREKGWL
ncbi:MAG: NAD-dependent epimerase/dehydratase family protein [candidate division Zixibacteria bacterium]|nr:NAD-dependent epimerase/dehydratase family protein [candidate division Zixibacteria bacterium]